jgi:hypothetical protein
VKSLRVSKSVSVVPQFGNPYILVLIIGLRIGFLLWLAKT